MVDFVFLVTKYTYFGKTWFVAIFVVVVEMTILEERTERKKVILIKQKCITI